MRIALTGSHGYIGRHVREALAGHDLDCFDLKIGRPYLELLYERQYEVILHLAAFSNVGASHKTSSLLASNVTDLAALVSGLRGFGPAGGYHRFVFVSSSAVYALPESGPYGLSKALGEEIVRAALPHATIVRPFNVIGGKFPDDTSNDHLIPKLFAASRSGKPFELYGSGEELRYYVHVDEMVRVLVAVAEGRLDQPEIEVRSDRAFTVKQVIELFQDRWPLIVQKGADRRDNPEAIENRSLTAWRETCSAYESIQRAFDDYALGPEMGAEVE